VAPIDKERFVNKGAEWFWPPRERFENGEIDIDPTPWTTSSSPSTRRL
jgi:hypothetical protein